MITADNPLPHQRLLDRLLRGGRVLRAARRARQLEVQARDFLLRSMDTVLERGVDRESRSSPRPPTEVAESIGCRPLKEVARQVADGLRDGGVEHEAAAIVAVEMRTRMIQFAVEAIERKLRARLWGEPEISSVVAWVRARAEDEYRDGARR